MAITIKEENGFASATVMVHDTDHYYIFAFTAPNGYTAVSLEAYDLDEGPQGTVAERSAETRDVEYNVRKCLGYLADWAVRNLSGWRARQALEAIGEAMELAD